MEIPYPSLKLVVQMSSRTNPPAPHPVKPTEVRICLRNSYTRALLPSQICERTKCKHTFDEILFGKDGNGPKSILAATACGIIFRQDLLKTQIQLEGSSPPLPGQDRLFLLHSTTTSLWHRVTRMCWVHPHLPPCTQGVDRCTGRSPCPSGP